MNLELSNDLPLVSVGVPVRNGSDLFEESLALLVNQTYKNLEIIISNNNSTDQTLEIASKFAQNDARIIIYNHSRTLTAVENFEFVLKKSSGQYFVWSAYDDRRSLDYIESFIKVMEEAPNASLVFGDVALFSDHSKWKTASIIDYEFECGNGMSVHQRIAKYIRFGCLQIYGLIRTDILKQYCWMDLDNGPDIPLLIYLSIKGDFVRSNNGIFFCFKPRIQKSLAERSRINSLRDIKPFPDVRLCWACAVAAYSATTKTYLPRLVVLAQYYLIAYFYRHWRNIKPWIFRKTPGFIVPIWRKIKKN